MTLQIETSPPHQADAIPLRALVVMPLAEKRGGGELMLLHLIEHGRGRGVNWTVAFLADGPMVNAVRGWGVDARIISAGRLRQPHRMASAIWRLRRLIRETNADVVLSWMGKAQLYGGTAAAVAGIPAVWYQLGLPDRPNWQDRLATAVPARLILTCSSSATDAQAKVWPRRPTRTIHPGVDLSRFNPDVLPTPAECRHKLGLPANGPLIGIAGRLQKWKGMHHLVDAMPALLQKYPDAHALIVGGDHAFEPDYPDFLRGQIAALGLTDRVIVAGFQPNVPEWMQAMDVVVHASDNEPFGLVVIEAMALGKPVIATNMGGPAEIITNSCDGILWKPADLIELGASIDRCLKDLAWSAELGKRAALRAADFDVQRYAKAVTDSTVDAAHPPSRATHYRNNDRASDQIHCG